jgi:hypothetical protein
MKNDLMGKKGWSLSGGTSYETVGSFASQNTINIKASYLGDNHSFSGFLNKNLDYNGKTTPIKTVTNSNYGGFITYNPTGVEKGWEIKVGLAGGYGDLQISREAIDALTEPGRGISPYESLNSLISAKYKMDYKTNLALEPYLGMSFNQNNLSSYKEASNSLVTNPLTFQGLESENTVIFSGFKLSHQVKERVKLTYNLEVNYDVNPKITPLVASGLNGLKPVEFKTSENMRYLVGVRSLFDLNKSSAIIFDWTLQATPFDERSHNKIELGYRINL